MIAVLKRDLQYLRGELDYETGIHRSPLSWLLALGVIRLLLPSGWRDRTFLGVALAAVAQRVDLAQCVRQSPISGAGRRLLRPRGRADGRRRHRRGEGLGGRAAEAARRWPRPGVLACAVIGLWTSFAYVHWVHHNNGNPPTSPGGIYTYLAARIPCYAAAKYLNHVAGRTIRAWGYSCEQARFYADGRLISDAFSQGAGPESSMTTEP